MKEKDSRAYSIGKKKTALLYVTFSLLGGWSFVYILNHWSVTLHIAIISALYVHKATCRIQGSDSQVRKKSGKPKNYLEKQIQNELHQY